MADYPCKDCEERKLGCHSACEKYLAVKAEKARVREALQEEHLFVRARKKRRKNVI